LLQYLQKLEGAVGIFTQLEKTSANSFNYRSLWWMKTLMISGWLIFLMSNGAFQRLKKRLLNH